MEDNAKDMMVYKGGDVGTYRTALLTPTREKMCKFDVEVVEMSYKNDDNIAASPQETFFDNQPEIKRSSKFVSFFRKDKAQNGKELRRGRMGRMTQSFSKFKQDSGKGLRNSMRRYRRSLKVITSKVVKADKTWVGCMIGMSTIDIFLNLANFVQMSDDNLNYSLVIGPPSRVLWYTLLVFTCISWLLYVPETLNSLSVLYSPARETYFPIAIEMTITLILKHIPLSTVVYFVGRCRREYTTSLESVCNGFRIVHILFRLVWYAHLEGRKLKLNDKHAMQKSFVLLSLLLFGVATSFVIKNWRNEPDTRLKRYHLVNVSILMLSQPHMEAKLQGKFPPEVKSFKYNISDLIRKHGYNVERPYLIKSILVIKERGSLTSDYMCNSSNGYQDMKPFECDKKTNLLRIRFVFYPPSLTSPYGEIRYNFGKLSDFTPLNSSSIAQSLNVTDEVEDSYKYHCTETHEELKRKWKMYYLEVKKYYGNLTNEHNITVWVSSPFRKTWTHPRPRYDDEVQVCKEGRVTCQPEDYPVMKAMSSQEARKKTIIIN